MLAQLNKEIKHHFFKIIPLYKKQIFKLSLLGLFSSVFLLLAPYFSRLFIDKAFLNRNFKVFLNLSFLGASVFIFSMLAEAAEDIIKNRIIVKLRLNLFRRFIGKIYAQDLGFFQGKSVGENAFRLFDIERVVNFVAEESPGLIVDILKLPIILGVSLWMSSRLTALLVILSPLFIVRSVYLQRKMREIYEGIWQASADLYKEAHEAFSRILIIKALGLESFQRHTYLKYLMQNIRLSIKNFRWSIISTLTSTSLSKAVFGLITLYGGWLIIKEKLSLGSYAAVMLYLNQLGRLLESLSQRFEYTTQEIVSLEKFFEVLDTEPKIQDVPGARALGPIRGEVKFDKVWFGYEKEKPIFKDFDFVIPAATWVAIVGPSGCGKTTLVNLILRLYPVYKGKIFLDGLDLEQIKLKSLRQSIAIATQQPLLFDVSIRENIGYGLKDVSLVGITEAAEIACVHDFINALPEGYNTLIGEDACRLSHGIKQRIAVARAILRNPQILILDEATSSVDSATEAKIFQALRQKRQGKSTIVISHRLSSVKDADRIYFLRQDQAMEEGRHEQLLTQSALYKEFFSNQLEGEKTVDIGRY